MNESFDSIFARIAELYKVPHGLKPSKIPVTIVCGPPGAGKSTYIAQRARVSDLVIDTDRIIARISGSRVYGAEPEWIAPALIERQRMLESLATDQTHAQAWFQLESPRAAIRNAWRQALGHDRTTVVLLLTSQDTCLARLRDDSRRAVRQPLHEHLIRRWFRDYSSDADEQVIRSP